MPTLAERVRSVAAAVKSAAGYSPIGTGGAEGEYRPGPWYLPVTHGWLPADVGGSINWWQNGYTPLLQSAQLAVIEACVSAYSQTVAMCPGSHWRANSKGGRVRVTNSALARILRSPNDYQTISDFLLNMVRQLYLSGNAYAYCIRNDRYEIDEIHLMDNRYCRAMIDGSGEVFYTLSGNWVVQNRYGPIAPVPQRDVLHIKLHCDQLRNPLLGQTPLAAAYLDTMTGATIRQQQYQFYNNISKPGVVLATELTMDKDKIDAVRDRWNEKSSGANVGGTTILTQGLKPIAIPQISNWRDAQLAEMLKLTDQDIAMAFRCPPQIVGLPGSGGAGSTEAQMNSWISEGLGFCLNHLEEAFGQAFALDGQPDEYVEFDTKALLRSNFKDRIEGLARGVQGGIYSPNEARNAEDLDSVKFGEEPRVQQQVVPLSQVEKIPAPPAPAPAPPAANKPEAPPGNKDDATKSAARIMRNRARQLKWEQQRLIA